MSGDDTTSVWVNGTAVATGIPYCGGACVPAVFNVPVSVFNQGQNVLVAVETDNINPVQLFSAWDMEITCNGGFQWVISSQTYSSIPLYFDPQGGCPGAAPPSMDGSGNPWTSFLYNPASSPFTLTAVPVTGSTYASPIYDPVTNAVIPPISFDASASVPATCGSLYWRQLIVIPTPTFTSTFTSTFTPTLTPTFTDTLTPSFTATSTYTPTFTYTPTITYTPSDTFTPTNTATVTPTNTPSNTPTITPTRTPTNSPTNTSTPTETFTPTSTPTPCGYPGNTCTPTPTPSNLDVFYVDHNLYDPGGGKPVSIEVAYSKYPGNYSLKIYNSAGEHIRTLADQTLSAPVDQTYLWDGKNKNGDICASGVYILYLVEPYSRKVKRILLVR